MITSICVAALGFALYATQRRVEALERYVVELHKWVEQVSGKRKP